MHTEETALAGTAAHPTGTPALTAVVPLARRTPDDPAAPGQIALPVVGTDPGAQGLSVHYELDRVTGRWVASILDDRSGEVLRTVSATQVLHHLAALRRPTLDLRA